MTVVMWNILAGDWDATVDPTACFERVIKKISDGDIIVFHESEKAWDRMSYCLPELLEYYALKGFCFARIDPF